MMPLVLSASVCLSRPVPASNVAAVLQWAKGRGLIEGGNGLAEMLQKATGRGDSGSISQAVSGPGEGAPVVEVLDLRGR
jgi:hypothetical protein